MAFTEFPNIQGIVTQTVKLVMLVWYYSLSILMIQILYFILKL